MPKIPDKSVDMILCDLPYGKTECKWDSVIPLTLLWEQYERIIKDDGAIVLFGSQPFTTTLINSNLKLFKYCLIWDKQISGSFAFAKLRPMISHEDICIFSKGATANGSKRNMKYNPQMVLAEKKNIRPVNNGSSLSEATFGERKNTRIAKSDKEYNPKIRYPKSILTYSKYMKECNQLNRIHPTQKPVALFEYLIKTYTNEGETVLDNCAGSFTTSIACLNTNRNYICIEKEKQYCDIGRQRIEQWHKEQEGLREGSLF